MKKRGRGRPEGGALQICSEIIKSGDGRGVEWRDKRTGQVVRSIRRAEDLRSRIAEVPAKIRRNYQLKITATALTTPGFRLSDFPNFKMPARLPRATWVGKTSPVKRKPGRPPKSKLSEYNDDLIFLHTLGHRLFSPHSQKRYYTKPVPDPFADRTIWKPEPVSLSAEQRMLGQLRRASDAGSNRLARTTILYVGGAVWRE